MNNETKQDEFSHEKIYVMYGVNTAIKMLRPGATWEIRNREFTKWEDERPCPTWQEIDDTMEKIKAFEDSINTVYTKQQLDQIRNNKIF